MNLAGMRTAVADELNSPDVSNQRIDDKINSALRRIQRAHDFSCLEREDVVYGSSGTATFSFPPNAQTLKSIQKAFLLNNFTDLGDSGEINENTTRFFLRRLESPSRWLEAPSATSWNGPKAPYGSGTPLYYKVGRGAGGNTTITLMPSPDKTYMFGASYYAFLPDLATDTDSNYFLENWPDLVLYGACAELVRFLEYDEKIAVYEALFKRELYGDPTSFPPAKGAIQLDVEEKKADLDFLQNRLPDLGFGMFNRPARTRR